MRQHPLLSPVALLATLLLLVAVALSVVRAGGQAFSPGPLSARAAHPLHSGDIASHAEIGTECSACHTPWRGLAAANCTTCHTGVGEQLARADGLHGRLTLTDCATCHREHQGADHDLLQAAHAHFPPLYHAALFPLEGEHAAVPCADCHTPLPAAGTPHECAGCHAEPEEHAGEYGLQCARCHTPEGWEPATLRGHPFPLTHGGLPEPVCEACHTERYAAYSCLGCHMAQEMEAVHPDLAQGELVACAVCHADGQSADFPESAP
jgi:hypothetical protein